MNDPTAGKIAGPAAGLGPARQMALPLPPRRRFARTDFLVSACNREAWLTIEGWQDWPGGRLALTGPARSGKSHLSAVWQGASGARLIDARDLPGAEVDALARHPLVVEDVPQALGGAGSEAVELTLLHLVNRMGECGSAMLLTGRAAPARWPAALPDLVSRLSALAVARIAPADDALLSSVIVKLAGDRQLVVPPAVLGYLVCRMERSFAAAERIVAALDRATLARRVRVTERLAAEVLEAERAPDTD